MLWISNGNRTEWSTIQGVSGEWFEITGTINPELYDMKSYYQLIVSITKCEKLFKSAVQRKAVKI